VHELISWFQINYPHLRDDLKDSMHNFDDNDLNPYHLESDCWSHTMMVCKISQIEEYDKVVKISALLHDIGKPSVRKVNLKNNHIHFFGHEVVSAYMSIEILKKMITENMLTQDEAIEVFLLIALHSVFHKDKNIVTLFEKFRDHKTLYLHLVDLNKCDNLGRFCKDWKNIYQKEMTLRGISKEMKDKPIPNKIIELFQNNSNYNEIDREINKLFNIGQYQSK
jgi:CRISPR/Cas system-associated endonuclease Cas3-HD